MLSYQEAYRVSFQLKALKGAVRTMFKKNVAISLQKNYNGLTFDI